MCVLAERIVVTWNADVDVVAAARDAFSCVREWLPRQHGCRDHVVSRARTRTKQYIVSASSSSPVSSLLPLLRACESTTEKCRCEVKRAKRCGKRKEKKKKNAPRSLHVVDFTYHPEDTRRNKVSAQSSLRARSVVAGFETPIEFRRVQSSRRSRERSPAPVLVCRIVAKIPLSRTRRRKLNSSRLSRFRPCIFLSLSISTTPLTLSRWFISEVTDVFGKLKWKSVGHSIRSFCVEYDL